MPTTAARRIAIVVVLVLLAVSGALATLPHRVGAVRIGSLSLLWWAAAVVAPTVATVVTAAALLRRPPSKGPVSLA